MAYDSIWWEEEKYQPLGTYFQNVPVLIFDNEKMADDIEFKHEVSWLSFVRECQKRFSAMCKELKKVGYKELWVGNNPFHKADYPWEMYATPAKEIGSVGVSLYAIASKFFPIYSGNAFGQCDHCQLRLRLPDRFVHHWIIWVCDEP